MDIRDSDVYKSRYYRVPRQPSIAWFGIASCSTFIFFNGWHVIMQIHKGQIRKGTAFWQLAEAYFAVSHLSSGSSPHVPFPLVCGKNTHQLQIARPLCGALCVLQTALSHADDQ
jgi:hypothetical protein